MKKIEIKYPDALASDDVETHRILYNCQRCDEEFGEGEVCPECGFKTFGDPIGCCPGDGCDDEAK